MNNIQRLLEDITLKLTRPASKFKPDDSVQLKKGGPLMVVVWVKLQKAGTPIVLCKWYDRERKSTQTNIFSEDDLLPFDWYHPD